MSGEKALQELYWAKLFQKTNRQRLGYVYQRKLGEGVQQAGCSWRPTCLDVGGRKAWRTSQALDSGVCT